MLITADIHCGMPGRLKDCMWSLKVMREYAHQNGILDVFILGDLFHDRVNLNIEVLTEVYDFFAETQEKYHQKWTTFPGNHDMFLKNSWHINSIRPLGKVLTAVDVPSAIEFRDLRFLILPFIYSEEEYLEQFKQINDQAQPQDILLTHVGVRGAELNRCFLLQHWSKVHFDDMKMSAVFTGHFHCQQQLGDRIWYPGSPISFRFDDGLVDHGFLVVGFNPRKVDFINIYDACSDKKEMPPQHLTNMDDMETATKIAKGNDVKIILSREYTANELSEMRRTLITAGARSVQFAHPKVQKETEQKMTGVKVDLRDHRAALRTWLKVDQPKDLDLKLLETLNGTISERAEEVLIEKGYEDDDS